MTNLGFINITQPATLFWDAKAMVGTEGTEKFGNYGVSVTFCFHNRAAPYSLKKRAVNP